ncbi:hypothetical protein NDU88_002230 [Pleurodeles waltl]|uniref:Uncharacterized protein n=1 Tax=Pleurodeles waltl TaxID=8319 RepID=A0AAV7M1J8_PLEWA|nr:hypothetical protein NDU88_002230 [Pleurodeles waltl]
MRVSLVRRCPQEFKCIRKLRLRPPLRAQGSVAFASSCERETNGLERRSRDSVICRRQLIMHDTAHVETSTPTMPIVIPYSHPPTNLRRNREVITYRR